jgi:hypothetical protein
MRDANDIKHNEVFLLDRAYDVLASQYPWFNW